MKSTPRTKQEGKAAAVRVMYTVRELNEKRLAPANTARFIDAQLREAVSWPAAARRGFSLVVSEWAADSIVGFGDTDTYAQRHGVRKPRWRHAMNNTAEIVTKPK